MLEHHLEKLRGFHAVAKEGTMVRASKKLAVSQPAISKSLRNLEEILGQTLLIRGRRGMTLTPAGQKLFSFCEGLFAKVEDLERSIGSHDEMSGVFRVGTYESLGETIWPSLLESLSRRHPHLDILIKTEGASSLWSELEDGSIDLIVDAEPRTSERFHSQVLFEDRFGIYRKAGALFPANGENRLPISYVSGATDRQGIHLRELLDKIGFKHRLVYDVQSFTFSRSLCLRGLCLSVLPERLASRHVNIGELEAYPVAGKRASFGAHRICATYPERMRKNRRLRRIVEVMREILGKRNFPLS